MTDFYVVIVVVHTGEVFVARKYSRYEGAASRNNFVKGSV